MKISVLLDTKDSFLHDYINEFLENVKKKGT